MITIRFAQTSDDQQLLAVTQKAFQMNPSFDDDFDMDFLQPQSLEKFFHNDISNPEGIFLVALDGTQVVGYINGAEKEIPYRKSRYFEIDTLATDPERQRQGIASQLIEALTKEARSRGFNKLYVNSYIRNQVARDFYQAKGFEEIDICLEKTI